MISSFLLISFNLKQLLYFFSVNCILMLVRWLLITVLLITFFCYSDVCFLCIKIFPSSRNIWIPVFIIMTRILMMILIKKGDAKVITTIPSVIKEY